VARKMPTVQITVNRAGVAAPVQLAAIASSDVIAAGLTAFAADTLAKPTMPDQFPELQIRGYFANRTAPNSRRSVHPGGQVAQGSLLEQNQ
jgi:hypothetical protein